MILSPLVLGRSWLEGSERRNRLAMGSLKGVDMGGVPPFLAEGG